MDKQIQFPSLDISFDLMCGMQTAQMSRIDMLDTKANVALGAATALVSAALLLQPLLLPSHAHSVCSPLVPGFLHALPTLVKRALPLLPLLISYICVMITALYAYKVRDYQQVPTPRRLYEHYLKLPEKTTKSTLFRTMIDAYEHNEQEIKRKAGWIDRAFVFILIEAVMLILLLLFQVIC